MNRSNIGNVVTNGMQILSVAGKNYGDFRRQMNRQNRADAASALNNMSMEELNAVGKHRARVLNDEIAGYEKKKSATMLEHMSSGEANQYGEYQADVARKKMGDFYEDKSIEQNETENVDDLMEGHEIHEDLPQTEQLEQVAQKVNSDINYYNLMTQPMTLDENGFKKLLEEKHEMLNRINKGGNNNANG